MAHEYSLVHVGYALKIDGIEINTYSNSELIKMVEEIRRAIAINMLASMYSPETLKIEIEKVWER